MARRTKPPPEAAKPKTREDPGPRWIYGIQPVLEALKSKGSRAEKVWIAFGRSGTAVQRILEQAKQQKTPVSFKDRAALDAKAGTTKHQTAVLIWYYALLRWGVSAP